MRPMIHTVAERAGVSIATVSRYLNGSARLGPATAIKVRRAIDELGYVPNAAARGLAMQSTETLALVFPRLSGPFFSELIRGAESAAQEMGYHLLIYGASNDNTKMVPTLAAKVDGLILASEGICLGCLETLQQRDTPVVVLGRTTRHASVDSLRPENIGGAQTAVTHLLGHGYRRIAMIAGPRTQQHAADRERGYEMALQSHGIPYDPALVVYGDFGEASGYRTMQDLLFQTKPIDAVFAANDQMAIGALAAAGEAGIRVPEDVALIGFDDITAACYAQPPLTTVHQDMHGQGHLAVRMLLARIGGSTEATVTEVTPTELVVRRSCGCRADGSRMRINNRMVHN